MKNNLALSISTTAAAPARRPAPSLTQTSQRQTVQMLGQLWRSLSFEEKATWLAAAKVINGKTPTSATNAPALNSYQTFIQMGGALYATQGTVPRRASSPPVFPVPFDNTFTLTASGSGPSFALTLAKPGGYPDKLIVRCAPPVPAGHSRFAKGAFKIIGTLPSLSPTTSITQLFLAHYHNPGPGATIAIELIGVSTSGLRSSPLTLTTLTFGTAADAPALTIE